MNRSLPGRAGVAVIAALTAGLGGTAHSGAAAPVTTTASVGASAAVPPGYRLVTDDTGLITVAVPESWHVVTAPQLGIDGVIWPQLQAGPATPVETEWGTAIYEAPQLRVDAEPYFDVEMPDAPGCVGQQVVALSGREPLVGYVEFDGSREFPWSISEPGEWTTECDGLFEQVVAGHADTGVTFRMVLWVWGAGDPPLAPGAREQAMADFDVALATLAVPELTYDQAVADYQTAAGIVPVPSAFIGDDMLAAWPYPTFHDVPRLGDEPVRGSGCGGDGSIGELIPDGLWSGYLFPGVEGTVEIDLACVYFGETARQVVAGGANVVEDRGPDFVVVNNNPRLRVLRDDGTDILWGVDDGAGNCVMSAAWGYPEPGIAYSLQHPESLAWVRVFDGGVRWVAFDCSTGLTLGG